MKRILLSLGAILFTGAVVISSTGAFFNDTETSTGNTFTAGAIDLTVDSQQHYNNMVCTEVTAGIFQWQPEVGFTPGTGHYPATGSTCDGTWSAVNLGAQKFFNFADVKPGDQGENTVSLHIENNPAWACAYIKTTANDENVAIEPETSAGDSATSTEGELAQNITFFTWKDNATTSGAVPGDNIWQAGEVVTQQPVTLASIIGATTTLTLADGGNGPALPGGSTSYIGLGWCAGTLTIGAPGTWTCNGASMGNTSQTDSVTANVSFYVEQERNNPNFRCVPPVVQETGTVTLDKVVTFSNGAIAGVDVTDYTLHLVGPGGDHILVDEVAMPGLTPGAYVVSEVYSGNPPNVVSNATFSGSCTEIGVTDTATLNVVSGVNPTCTITNSVSVVADVIQ